MDEKKLISLLDKNPDKAIAIIIEEHGRGVHTICKNVLRDFSSGDVEEAEADAYYKLWKNRRSIQIDPKHSLKSYLYAIARNAAIDKFRQKKPQALPFEDGLEELLVDETCVEDEAVGRTVNQLLYEVIAGLGKPDCDVFFGKYFLFLKNREIAQQLGITEKKVENILYRGKEKLRNALKERGFDGYVK